MASAPTAPARGSAKRSDKDRANPYLTSEDYPAPRSPEVRGGARRAAPAARRERDAAAAEG